MPTAFEDLSAKADGLFGDHHNAGNLTFKKAGKVGSGGATYEFNSNSSVNGGPIGWKCEVDAGFFKLEHDHEGTIKKSFDFDVKQVPGLKANWSPTFNQKSGLSVGDIKMSYGNDKVNANVTMGDFTSADFDLTVAPLAKCPTGTLGLKGTLGASGLSNASFAYGCSKNDLEMSFKSQNLTDIFKGRGTIYKALPDNKTFCCYGVEADNINNTFAVAAATGCCSTGLRYKLDNAGTFSVARISKVNRAVAMTLSAEVNATNLGAGGHKFGVGFSFE